MLRRLASSAIRCHGQIAAGQFCSALDETPEVFDRALKATQRDSCAFQQSTAEWDPLHTQVSAQLLDRLRDIVRKFESVLVLGGAGGPFLHAFLQDEVSSSVRRISYVDQALNAAHLVHDRLLPLAQAHALQPSLDIQLADEEFLPFPDATFDLVVSCHALHWVNDPPRALSECRRVLGPDRLFMASMLGGDTLEELRRACQLAEEERDGGFSLRTSPLIHVRDAGSMLTTAKFTLQTVDVDDVHVAYSDAGDAVLHLRAMAEQNAALHRRQVLPRDTALAAAALFTFGSSDFALQSTFQNVFMTGWSPSSAQPRPAPRGSQSVSLKDLQHEMQKRKDTDSQDS